MKKIRIVSIICAAVFQSTAFSADSSNARTIAPHRMQIMEQLLRNDFNIPAGWKLSKSYVGIYNDKFVNFDSTLFDINKLSGYELIDTEGYVIIKRSKSHVGFFMKFRKKDGKASIRNNYCYDIRYSDEEGEELFLAGLKDIWPLLKNAIKEDRDALPLERAPRNVALENKKATERNIARRQQAEVGYFGMDEMDPEKVPPNPLGYSLEEPPFFKNERIIDVKNNLKEHGIETDNINHLYVIYLAFQPLAKDIVVGLLDEFYQKHRDLVTDGRGESVFHVLSRGQPTYTMKLGITYLKHSLFRNEIPNFTETL